MDLRNKAASTAVKLREDGQHIGSIQKYAELSTRALYRYYRKCKRLRYNVEKHKQSIAKDYTASSAIALHGLFFGNRFQDSCCNAEHEVFGG
jgi:hypothetical protein